MTRIYDDPEVFATTAIAGFSSIYARHVRPVTGGVLRSTATPEGKVALVAARLGKTRLIDNLEW